MVLVDFIRNNRKHQDEEPFKTQHFGLYNKLPKSYWYYDTPDGQDCIHKMWFCMKAGAVLGGVASFYDVLMFTKPVGYANVAFRIGYSWLFASMATGAMYSNTACAALEMRKKDDKLNHFIAGIVAGCTWGAARSGFLQGLVMAGTLASVGMYIKDCNEYNNVYLPFHKNRAYGFWQTWPEFDFTLTPDERLDDRTSDAAYRTSKWGVVAPSTGSM